MRVGRLGVVLLFALCCLALPTSAAGSSRVCARVSTHHHRYWVERDQSVPSCDRTRSVVHRFLLREPLYPGVRYVSGWRCGWGSKGQGWCTKRYRGRTLVLRFMLL